MTILIVGGAYQGKTLWASEQFGLSATAFFNGAEGEMAELPACLAVNQLHLLIRRLLQRGQTFTEIQARLLPMLCEKVILCDDISCGIVPIEPFECDYREAVGRILCELAKYSDAVVRVQCGVPQMLKGHLLR